MVTIKFEAGKLNSEIALIPTIVVTTGTKKNNIGISICWFNGVFTIDINWSCKTKSVQLNNEKSSH